MKEIGMDENKTTILEDVIAHFQALATSQQESNPAIDNAALKKGQLSFSKRSASTWINDLASRIKITLNGQPVTDANSPAFSALSSEEKEPFNYVSQALIHLESYIIQNYLNSKASDLEIPAGSIWVPKIQSFIDITVKEGVFEFTCTNNVYMLHDPSEVLAIPLDVHSKTTFKFEASKLNLVAIDITGKDAKLIENLISSIRSEQISQEINSQLIERKKAENLYKFLSSICSAMPQGKKSQSLLASISNVIAKFYKAPDQAGIAKECILDLENIRDTHIDTFKNEDKLEDLLVEIEASIAGSPSKLRHIEGELNYKRITSTKPKDILTKFEEINQRAEASPKYRKVMTEASGIGAGVTRFVDLDGKPTTRTYSENLKTIKEVIDRLPEKTVAQKAFLKIDRKKGIMNWRSIIIGFAIGLAIAAAIVATHGLVLPVLLTAAGLGAAGGILGWIGMGHIIDANQKKAVAKFRLAQKITSAAENSSDVTITTDADKNTQPSSIRKSSAASNSKHESTAASSLAPVVLDNTYNTASVMANKQDDSPALFPMRS